MKYLKLIFTIDHPIGETWLYIGLCIPLTIFGVISITTGLWAVTLGLAFILLFPLLFRITKDVRKPAGSKKESQDNGKCE